MLLSIFYNICHDIGSIIFFYCENSFVYQCEIALIAIHIRVFNGTYCFISAPCQLILHCPGWRHRSRLLKHYQVISHRVILFIGNFNPNIATSKLYTAAAFISDA